MLTEHLQLLRDAPLALVYGYSMGGCMALEWAVSFSRQVARASVSGTLLCGIAALWYCSSVVLQHADCFRWYVERPSVETSTRCRQCCAAFTCCSLPGCVLQHHAIPVASTSIAVSLMLLQVFLGSLRNPLRQGEMEQVCSPTL